MVTYIKSDLEFILAQIKIAEAHAGGQKLYGEGGLIPTYNLAWGLRTVDGSYNHLLEGQEQWGAANHEFPELLNPVYRPADGTPFDPDGPGPAPEMPTASNYNPSNNPNSLVFDSSLRTISNLLVDQTLGNPAAILTALERAGSASAMTDLAAVTTIYLAFKPAFDAEYQARVVMQNAKAAADELGDGDPLTPPSPAEQAALDALAVATTAHAVTVTALEAARVVRDAALEPFGIAMDGDNVHLPNLAPDEGLSAPFNSWFTLFGQFFDHGLDLVNKGGSGTVFIPLQPDDPLYVEGSHTNFMVLTRATVGAGADGIMNDNPATQVDESADNTRPVNTTTSYVDQNQTYTSHSSHQVFLRQYEMEGDRPVATGKLIEGENGGMATWGEVKEQARMLGIELTDFDVGSVPLLRTDQYGNFIPNAAGFAQIIIGLGGDGIPNTSDDLVISGTDDAPINPTTVGAIRTGHAFLADIAHDAVPIGKIADGDITIGLGNPGNGDAEYDNELLDAHFIAGDGRVNENIGLTAVHHVFHAEHNRLVEHTKETVLATNDLAFINEWLATDIAALPTTPAQIAALVWDGERLFQAAKFGTEMQYQHLVFEEFARKIQPNINVFLVPDGFDTTMDPSIVAEFAHVVYRFGHSMLTESIDRFNPAFTADHIGLIEGFLNPTAFDGVNHAITDDVAAGAIIRGMTRQAGNEIDEFVTSALRNNLLGLPLDLATINLARGRDTGVPSLNEARAQFYEATNHDSLLKPYESWVDFAGHLKHEASIINFIAAYGTHATITGTLEERRDAAMALVGLTTTGSQTVALSNASFEADSLDTGALGVITDPLGNYTLTAPTGWTMTGTGGLFAPTAGVTTLPGLNGAKVAWLSQDAMLSRDTGVTLEAGNNYSLSFDIGDRFDMAWPGGVARLVTSNGTVLASLVLAPPADGNWSTVTLQTGVLAAGFPTETLRIEIQQTGGTTNQILVDDIQLNVLSPLTPLNEDDRQAFLNGTGQYASNLGGLNNVDLWIGGLAEEIMPFGGMLGSTFNFVFEVQMEKLQSGDRFYYLQRLDGLHLFGEMENNSFAAMMMRNTDATHLPSDVFSTPGLILEIDRTKQYNPGLGEDGGLDGILADDPLTAGDESADNRGLDPTGDSILTPLVIRNNPATVGPDTNYLRYTGGDHVVLGGTDANDTLISGIGDDTLYGDKGNDRLEGGFGNDIINGGEGDDIIVDSGGDDNIKAGTGHDVVHAGPGLDLVMGNDGQDFIFLGTDMGSEVFAGTGNDFIYGNKNAERILGNEGNDWIETGTFDGAPGDNFDEIFAHDGIDGHDVFLGDGGFDEFIGEGGDDIFVGSAGRGKMVGMSGFDWATYKDNTFGVNADLSIPIIFDEAPTLPQNASLDEYESVEGLSGTKFNDILAGTNDLATDRAPLSAGGTTGYLGSVLDAQGIALIAGLQAVLGAGVNSFDAGDIILGGDGSDIIQGNAGDDIIDGDKYLNVRIGIMSGHDINGPTGTEVAGNPNIKSMTSLVTLRLDANGNMVTAPTGGTETTKSLSAWMFEGKINPGQLQIIREITTAGADAIADIDTARYQGARGEYAFSATADGQLIVTHAVEDSLDGTDRLRNIERIQFSTGPSLNIIVGTPNPDTLTGTAQDDLILGLGSNDTLNGGEGNDILVGGANGAVTSSTFLDNFDGTASYTDNNGTLSFTAGWAETNDGTTSPTGGDILITAGRLRFAEGTDGGEIISRAANLTGYNSATLSFAYEGDDLDDGENVVVEAFNGTGWDALGTLGGDGNGNFSVALTAAQIGSHTAVRFRAQGTFEGGENFYIDNFTITVSNVETLNGGLGDDTYSFAQGDGIDVINEIGGIDRIAVSGTVPPALPAALTGLNMFEVTVGGGNDDLVVQFNGQQVTVTDHFDTAGEAVEFINFNGSTFEGYVLTGDYALSIDDNGERTAAAGVNTALAGTTGEDTLTGSDGFDLLFGHDDDDTLNGGLGEDLLVGGAGNDTLNGGDDIDTLVGGAGNDTYVDDTGEDIIVEVAGAPGGVDTVETTAAVYSIATFANVENLTYTGVDADQFVGTGNDGNNAIIGGDLADTLTGLAGNDTLDGGLGADTMIGGLNDDVYFVDDAGDVVTEVALGGIDRVESSIDYTLGAQVENLDVNGTAVVGRGNALANVINGNGSANQLFGGGDNDTLSGAAGADLLDGGDGNDTLNGGDDNDTIIGGAGNDTIDVGGGFNTIVYNALGFGADIINSFDATGGTPATQDRIDLSGLGVTAANFDNRVFESTVGGNTVITIRENGAASAAQGTIQINGIANANIDQSDFTLATAGNVITGGVTGQTHNGTAGADTINALGGNDIVNANAGNDIINGGTGNDTLNGDDGDDTFNWNANNATAVSLTNSDGRDIVNGGTEGAAGDTFVINGNSAVAEIYQIYTRDAWDAIAGNNVANLNAATEIVVTRGTGSAFNTAVIAELREIEEIRINGFDPAAPGTIGGDTIQIIGDFSGTSLRLNTITIDGEAGDDTVDISALTSAHRIVFRSNGGNDTIIGTLRPQDVIELPDGAVPEDYETTTDENGVTTMTSPTHSICFTAGEGMPQFGHGDHDDDEDDEDEDDHHGDDEDDEDEDDHHNDDEDDDDDDHHGNDDDDDDCGCDDDDDGPSVPAPTGTLRVGTAGNDVLIGTAAENDMVGLAGDDVLMGEDGADTISGGEGADFIKAGAGADVVFAGAGDDQAFGGAGADMLYGETGADTLFGEGGNDMIDAGTGNDTVIAGAGNDRMVGGQGDGDDTYFGDDSDGGDGIDTLDLSAITANLTVDLGNGLLGRGSASSSQSGSDTLWHIENVATGSGSDTITASNAVNVMEGGSGNDTFRFLSTAGADGDTILDFEPGDRLDLSGIDANTALAGNQAFTLENGPTFTASAQLLVTYETRADGAYTIVSGNVDANNADDEFRIDLKGTHTLTNGNFTF